MCTVGMGCMTHAATVCAFFFFIFKKIKISKIYVHFGKFQKYTSVAPHRATGPLHGPVAHPEGDRDPFVIKIFTTRLLETYL